jgi:hypothetical protein
MGRKTYWRALDVNATLIVSKAVAGAGITSQYASKDIKTKALILPITALLYRSLTLVPNDIRMLAARRFARNKTRTYSEPGHMPSGISADRWTYGVSEREFS